MAGNQNYTLGRGKLYFSRFIADTQLPEGYEYIGNTPELSLTIGTDNLDHFSSDAGIREKDDSVPLQVNRTGAFTTDSVKPENLAYFFFGAKDILSYSSASVVDEPINDIIEGRYYALGAAGSNPIGARNITTVSVKKAPSTSISAATNWEVDLVNGVLHILDGAVNLADGDDLLVSYTQTATTRQRIMSGFTPIEGALMFLANNPKGENFNYKMPWVKLTPNGDYALKSDVWQTIPFNLEVLKTTSYAAIYVDGVPFVA